MWKLNTTAKDNFVYVSILKQQENIDIEFISVSFSTVTAGYIRFHHISFFKIVLFEDRIVLF